MLTDHGTDVTVRIVGEAFNIENDGMQILTDPATLARRRARTWADDLLRHRAAGHRRRRLRRGVEHGAGAASARRPSTVDHEPAEIILIINTLTALLSLMLVTVAGLGVLNMVVLETRERVHDLGVHKALGMTPRQTIAMVIASVVVTGLVGGAVGAPVGVVLQRHGHQRDGPAAPASTCPPRSSTSTDPVELLLFGLGGLVIAVVGALLPAGWAAQTRTATALRTE